MHIVLSMRMLQDGYYFMIQPQSAVTMWLALEPANLDNGCLRYVRDSLAGGLRKHDYSGVMGFSQCIVDYDSSVEDEMTMCAEPGDLIIHHSLMVHRAERNNCADRSRKAVGAIFYGVSAQVDQVKYELKQQEIRERAAMLEGQTKSSVGLSL